MSVVTAKRPRAGFLDEWRGVALICMLIYHTAYDLYALFGVPLPLFTSPFYVNLQRFIGFSFILISGISCSYSRNNLRRGAICFGCGMIMTIATALVMPEQLILFGVLHFLGAAMLLYALLQKAMDKIPAVWGMIGAAILYVLFQKVSYGMIGIGSLQIELPDVLYSTNVLFPLGFYAPDFSSADYYPLLPWFFLFMIGAFWGRYWKTDKMPAFVYRTHFKPLAFLGRHTILVYIVHQPVIYGLLLLFFMVI